MRWALTIALLATVVPATAASAADVRVVREDAGAGGDLLVGATYVVEFIASPGESNDVEFALLPAGVTQPGNEILVTDAGAPLRPGDGCRPAATGISCAAPDGSVSAIRASLGDRDDKLVSRVSIDADGGPGDDVLSATEAAPGSVQVQGKALSLGGGEGNDQLFGSSSDDRLTGDSGNDLLAGGRGADELDGGEGADVMRGGAGLDHVGYDLRTAAVRVTLDGVADDGEAGEGDNVGRDVEQLSGGKADDVLVGSDAADQLVGGRGDDRLEGRGGVDVLDGGTGVDTLVPGAGRDRVFADGPDVLALRDRERDRVSCQKLLTGRVRRDARDRFTGCAPLPTVVRTTLRASRDARVAVPLRCQRGGLPCEGVIALLIPRSGGHGGTPMGRARFRVAPGRSERTRIRVKGRSRAALLGGRRVTADVRISVGAIETSAKRPLRLLPPS